MDAKVCLLLGALMTACVSSIEEDITLTPSPTEDEGYRQALEKATKSRTIFKDFENRYQLTATYLSPEFRSAFAQRMARVYKNAPMQFEEASAKAGFFVTIEAPNDDRIDLTNPHHWSIFLGSNDKNPLKPVLVKKLDDKERWRAFFDSVTPWTTEYLIVFDAPSVNANSKDLVAKTPINLMFANADAQLSLNW